MQVLIDSAQRDPGHSGRQRHSSVTRRYRCGEATEPMPPPRCATASESAIASLFMSGSQCA